MLGFVGVSPAASPSYIHGQQVLAGSRLLPICLIWLCKFVGMNSSSLLRPAAGYGKIEKRKARDARLTRNAAYVLYTAVIIRSNGGYFRPLKIV